MNIIIVIVILKLRIKITVDRFKLFSNIYLIIIMLRYACSA